MVDIYTGAPDGQEIFKALQDVQDKGQKIVQPKSSLIDPYTSLGLGNTRQKPTAIPFQTLRRMASVPAIAAVIQTRLNQVARFSRRPRYDGDLGFRIGLKDKDAKMTDAAKKRAFELEEFFLKTGMVKNAVRKDNFNHFLRKITRDTLTLDAMAWENVPNMKGGLSEVWALDAATIELVMNNPIGDLDYQMPVYVPVTRRGLRDGGNIAYVQKINGRPTAEYTEEELAYAIRNPRTDIEFTDFGYSELEMLIEIVTGIVNGVRYNTSYFSHSHLPQGVLEVVGNYEDKHLEGFKRQWKTLTSGAAGKWSVPVMAMQDGQGFKFTPFKNSNRDMEFNEFLEFLFNIACAVYQIDPNEVGFKSWTSGSGMTQSDNTEAKMDESKDKGFVPLMTFLSDTFNAEIMDRIDEDFVFEWVGLDAEDEDSKLDRQTKQMQNGTKTVRMIWEENDVDMESIKKANGGEFPKWIDAPANPQLIQVFMAESGLQQQGQPQPGDDEQDPNQEAENQQNQADDSHDNNLEVMDKQHDNELEKMDKEHEQNIEMEKLKAKNSQQLAKAKPQPQPGKPEQKPAAKKPLKKSLTEDDDSITISLGWDEY